MLHNRAECVPRCKDLLAELTKNLPDLMHKLQMFDNSDCRLLKRLVKTHEYRGEEVIKWKLAPLELEKNNLKILASSALVAS